MKVQALLPWVFVLGLAAGAAVLYTSGQKKDADLERLRAENQEAQNIRTELAETKKQVETQSVELEGLRKDKTDLLRLRNEVRQLQTEKEQLSKQIQSAQSDAQRAQAQATQVARTAQASAQQLQQLQQLQNENQQLRTGAAQSQAILQRNGCINNLRQLDGAKQQWALENGKSADVVPQPQEIAPYIREGILPTCPGGGTYTLNAVNQPPTCSIPGHALPK